MLRNGELAASMSMGFFLADKCCSEYISKLKIWNQTSKCFKSKQSCLGGGVGVRSGCSYDLYHTNFTTFKVTYIICFSLKPNEQITNRCPFACWPNWTFCVRLTVLHSDGFGAWALVIWDHSTFSTIHDVLTVNTTDVLASTTCYWACTPAADKPPVGKN